MSYTVTSERLAGHQLGDVLSDDEADSLDVADLIASGHLAPVGDDSAEPAQTEPETAPETPPADAGDGGE